MQIANDKYEWNMLVSLKMPNEHLSHTSIFKHIKKGRLTKRMFDGMADVIYLNTINT